MHFEIHGNTRKRRKKTNKMDAFQVFKQYLQRIIRHTNVLSTTESVEKHLNYTATARKL